MQFRDLKIGQSFDFIDAKNPTHNSFFLRCEKTGPRTYTDSSCAKHRIGSVNAEVYNV